MKRVSNRRTEIRRKRKREGKRRKGVKGGTGHSRGILTAWENNGQKDEREKKGGGGIL